MNARLAAITGSNYIAIRPDAGNWCFWRQQYQPHMERSSEPLRSFCQELQVPTTAIAVNSSGS